MLYTSRERHLHALGEAYKVRNYHDTVDFIANQQRIDKVYHETALLCRSEVAKVP